MTRGFALQQCPGSFKFQCFETGVHSPNKMMYGKTRPNPRWTMAEAQIKIRNDLEKQSCTRNMQILHFSSAMAVRLSNWPIHKYSKYFLDASFGTEGSQTCLPAPTNPVRYPHAAPQRAKTYSHCQICTCATARPDDLSLTCANARSQSLVLEYHLFLVLISFQRRSTTNNVLKKATKG
jgi:hypothetical protein